MPNVYVVQTPRNPQAFDMKALQAMGNVEYLLPVAPNMHDPHRMATDFERMLNKISGAEQDDMFVMLGGSPISNALWGAAAYASDKDFINVALYSRDIDGDGRRLDEGRYRVVAMDWREIGKQDDAQAQDAA